MAYTYDFKDNVVYGADDINAIRASILTKGVVEESQSSCKVTAADTGVKINKGQAIFKDGCKIEVDDEGVHVGVTAGEKNYVYFYNNILAGLCEVKADVAKPSGDYILLAEVDEEGNIWDKREFAQLKTADAERYAASFSGTLTMHDDMEIGGVIGEIELPKSNCSYLEFEYRFATQSLINIRVFPKEDGYVIWRDNYSSINAGKTFKIDLLGKTREIKFEVNGNKLIFRHMSISPSGDNNTYNISVAGVCMR